MPNSELLIGQFLFYSKVISWDNLINAIVWQRRQRPLFGKIAKEWGILSNDEIIKILRDRKKNEKIGEYAIRNGYLNSFEQMAIVGKQRSIQRPIGEFFIKNWFITSQNMEIMVGRQQDHNQQVRLRKNAIISA